MDLNRIAEIFVPRKDSDGKVGSISTGYPISNNLIITTRHSLYPEGGRDTDFQILVRWRHPDVASKGEWNPVKGIAWEGEGGKWDLALLECDLPSCLTGFTRLGSEKPKHLMRWASIGFPALGGKKNRKRSPFPMSGTVQPVTDDDDFFYVVSETNPENVQDWKGASGSPVFVNGNMLGVITDAKGGVHGRMLEAIPLWKVCKYEESFRNLVQGDDAGHQELVQEIALKIKALLGMQAQVATLLHSRFTGSERVDRLGATEQTVQNLVVSILDCDAGKLIENFYEVHKKIREKLPANCLGEVINIILPVVYENGIVAEVKLKRNDPERPPVPVPIHRYTVAEIIMAGVDGRKADFHLRQSDTDYPKGKLCLPGLPESGFSMNQQFNAEENLAKALDEHLVSKFSPELAEKIESQFDDFVYLRLFSTDSQGMATGLSVEQRIEEAADELHFQSHQEGKTYYLAVMEPQEQSDYERLKRTLFNITAKYPDLICLVLSVDPNIRRSERTVFRPFLELLPKRTGDNP